MGSIAEQLGTLKAAYDTIERAHDFAAIGRVLLSGRGTISEAQDHARIAPRLSDRVRRIFSAPDAADIFVSRAAQQTATLAGSALSEYRIAAAGFASSLSNTGVFDRLLNAGFRTLPMSLVSVGATNIAAVGVALTETGTKPVSSLSVAASQTTIRKAVGLVAMTAELARAIESLADTIVANELRIACTKAIDAQLISIAIAGAPAANASGTNLAAFFADVGFLLNAVGVGDVSRLYLLMTSSIAKQVALMTAAGSATNTVMTPQGGTVAGIPALVSDSLATGQMVLLDAAQFAAASDTLMLSTIAHGNLQFDSSPDSPSTAATNIENLWQSNKLALICERWFICERLRSNAVAAINGANYAPTGFSP